MKSPTHAQWTWLLTLGPLATAILMLGRVWFHPHDMVGYDQFANARVLANAVDYLAHPGSAPWSWPAEAPACQTDHCIGLALLNWPFRVCALEPVFGMWCTTVLILALNGTLLGVLLRRWGIAPGAALCAAVLAVSLPVLIQRLMHTNNLEMCWILAWVLAVDYFAEKPAVLRALFLGIAGIGLAIQPGTVLQFTAPLVPLLAIVVHGQRPLSVRAGAVAAAVHLPALALMAWIYWPFVTHPYPPNYIIPSPVQDLLRPLGEVAWTLRTGQLADNVATPGPVPVIGVIGLIIGVVVNHRRRLAGGLLVAVVVCALCGLTFGGGGVIDLLRHLPLYGGMRSPGRFLVPACVLSLAGLAVVVDLALARRRPGFAVAVIALAVGGQVLVDGGPVAPLLLLRSVHIPVEDVAAHARPGPVCGIPAGFLDDAVAVETGRITVGTSLGIPYGWPDRLDVCNNAQDGEGVALVILALQRQGLAGVVVDHRYAMPGIDGVLTKLGAREVKTASPLISWWELPPAAPGVWASRVEMGRDGAGNWQVAFLGDPGAAPVEGMIIGNGVRLAVLPLLPGTAPYGYVLPPGPQAPVLRLSREMPVMVKQ